MPQTLECRSCGLLTTDPRGDVGTRCPRCGEVILPPPTLESRVQGAGTYYRTHRFPRWMGPVVGPIAGAAMGLKSGMNQAGPPAVPLWQLVAAFAAIGLLAGCILAIYDGPSRRR